MAFIPKKQVFGAKIAEVALGTGQSRIVLGGQNVLPFYTFDAPMPNSPKIAVEISDRGPQSIPSPALSEFYEGCVTVAEMAARAQTMPGASAICLRFESADPNAEDASAENCAALAKEVCESIALPLIVQGCQNAEKDARLFKAVSQALAGKNVLILSCCEDNYAAVGTDVNLNDHQMLAAESSVDINLAKQLNVLLGQLGVPYAQIVMNLGSSAAGYGFEYLASTMERVRLAALMQDDRQLQMPIIAPVSMETWNCKEAQTAEEEQPEWGSREERIIEMEIATASACLCSGADMVIMKHPKAVAAIARFIDSLM